MSPRPVRDRQARGRRPLLTGASAALAVALAATLSGAVVGTATAGSDAVAVHQVYLLPAKGSFTATGHGYGHGHGMSQYGAEGAARKGLDYREILQFYYPGTKLATKSVHISVRIDEDTTPDLQVRARAGLAVKDRGNGRVYRLSDRPAIKRWRLGVRRGQTVLSYRTTTWHRYRPGGHAHLRGEGEFSASGPVTLVLPGGRTMRLRGHLRSAKPARGSSDRDTVNVLPMEQYLRGVVPQEMPALWHQAALRAQAVAARTYAMEERSQHLHRYYQICDTSACQVYGGRDAEHPNSDRAVKATRGRYLTYLGEPAFTQFSSSSGGWTSQGSAPYLSHHSDPYDGWSGNPMHTWQARVPIATLRQRFPGLGALRQVVVTRREGGGQWHGRVQSLRLVGTKASRTMTGDDFRYYCGLRSTWFAIT